MASFIIVGLVLVLLYFFGNLIKKCFQRFVITTDKRKKIWGNIKCCIFIIFSIFFIYATFERWHYFQDELFYSGNKMLLNPEYASQVEIETYLMSKQNVIDLFEGNSFLPDMQDVYKNKHMIAEPKDPRFFLVIRIKNTGKETSWGVINCFINDSLQRQIDIPPLPAKMEEFKNIVLFTYPYNPNIPEQYPKLHAEWHKLYTSGGNK